MRRALPWLAALALAGCQVEVEGARCRDPGTTADCPEGQACGNDGRCSERAAACVAAATMCLPTAAPRCRAAAAIERCGMGPDPVCGAWVISTADEDCAARALECREATAGQPACVCRTPAQFIHADPTAPSGPLAPTGADAPPECRFARLGEAIAYAKDVWMPAHGGAPATVRAMGTPAPLAPVVFGAESFPLVIPGGVTLATSAATPMPSDWRVSAPAGTNNLVELHSGATVDGFMFVTKAATGDGIVIACDGGTSPATARNIVVDGGGTLDRGVVVTGDCDLVATQLNVSGAAKAGLYVSTSSTASGVTVTDGSLKDNGESGAEVVGGRLSISGSSVNARFEISQNKRHGVRAATDPVDPRAIALTLNLADVHRNDEVGVLVKELVPASSASVSSSLIRWNSASAAFSQYGSGRVAGGVLLWGNLPMTQDSTPLPAFAFKGNTVCSNARDAIGVYSNEPWPLSGDECGPTSNVFANVATSGYYVYSTATSTVVPAIWNRWAPDPPTGLVMKAVFVPSCGFAVAPVQCE